MHVVTRNLADVHWSHTKQLRLCQHFHQKALSLQSGYKVFLWQDGNGLGMILLKDLCGFLKLSLYNWRQIFVLTSLFLRRYWRFNVNIETTQTFSSTERKASTGKSISRAAAMSNTPSLRLNFTRYRGCISYKAISCCSCVRPTFLMLPASPYCMKTSFGW